MEDQVRFGLYRFLNELDLLFHDEWILKIKTPEHSG